MRYDVCLAGIYVAFRDFAARNFWVQWHWKLNPYEMSDASHFMRSITVVQSSSHIPVACKGLKTLLDEPNGFYQKQVHRLSDGGTLWQYLRRQEQKVYLQCRVSPEWDEITLLVDETNTAGQAAFEYLGQMMPCLLLKHDILTFHGVLMEHRGKGIIISANSGVGKTTHARLWRDLQNALIINGDRATCRKADGVWTGYGLPWSGTSGEQINRSVPLSALVILERGEVNEAHRISGLEAFGAALPHVQCPSWDAQLTGTAMELMDDFLRNIPVVRLRCRPDAESVEVLSRVLEETGA